MVKETTRGTRRTEKETARPVASRRGASTRVVAGARVAARPAARVTARGFAKRTASPRKVVPLATKAPRQIPRKQWQEFLDDFSTRRDGWLTRVQVVQPGQTARLEAHDLPLDGISIDFKPDEDVLSIEVGKQPGAHITHIITDIDKITLRNAAELEIETEDGSKTIVRCQIPEED